MLKRKISITKYLAIAILCTGFGDLGFAVQQTEKLPQEPSAKKTETQKPETKNEQSADSPEQQIKAELRRIGREYKLQSVFAGYQTLGQPFVGAAAGLRKNGSKQRVTIDDKVHLGSCTKAMTATLIARLIEQGALEPEAFKHGPLTWDTTIKEGLPELFKTMDPIYADVTLRQLLMHRGGCPANTAWTASSHKKNLIETRRSVLRIALKKEQPNKPGEFLYSNVGYVVAGAIAERATGKSWEDLMREEIFKPLDIKSAGFGPPDVDKDVTQPWGHLTMGSLQIPRHFDNPAALGPAGTVHMSIGDWAKFCLSHTLQEKPKDKGDESKDGESKATEAATKLRLVSQSTLDFLHKPLKGADDDGKEYALGWLVKERGWGGTVFVHNGSNNHWTAIVWVSPKNRSVYLAATNIANAEAGVGLDEIFGTLMPLEEKARGKGEK